MCLANHVGYNVYDELGGHNIMAWQGGHIWLDRAVIICTARLWL